MLQSQESGTKLEYDMRRGPVHAYKRPSSTQVTRYLLSYNQSSPTTEFTNIALSSIDERPSWCDGATELSTCRRGDYRHDGVI